MEITSKKEFNKILKKLASANEKYKALLSEAEDIFVERYGNHPSEVDFDSWIDVYHAGIGFMSAESIEKEIKQSPCGLTIPDKT